MVKEIAAVSEQWVIRANDSENRWPVYYNNDGGWWSDQAHATLYATREEAEKSAFMVVAKDLNLPGNVEVVLAT